MSLSSRHDSTKLSSTSPSQNSSSTLPSDGKPTTVSATSRLFLSQEVFARRAEFTAQKSARIKIGTWNVASFKDVEKDLSNWFVREHGASESPTTIPLSPPTITSQGKALFNGTYQSDTESLGDQEASYKAKEPTFSDSDPRALRPGDNVDIYALGLQEIVDINSAVEALRPFSDASASNKFKAALEGSLPPRYKLIAEQQLVGLLLLVYAGPDIAPQIQSVITTSVGTGLMGYMGNKGAVTARIVLGASTSLVFVNSHLSAGVGKTELERRNWDAAQVANRTRFEIASNGEDSLYTQIEKINDADYSFWFGDLNYRLEGIPADDVRRILTLHTCKERNEEWMSDYKVDEELTTVLSGYNSKTMCSSARDPTATSSMPSHSSTELQNDEDDPTSLQATLASLLQHDELRQQQSAGKAFHDGWREGRITFLPTYKYDVGSVADFDSGEKKRGPSWCDRILYRTKRDRLLYEDKIRTEQEAKERDNQMRAQGIERAAEDESTMFEYDPEVDGDEDYEDRSVISNGPSEFDALEIAEEAIRVEFYGSHQHILSSDHKPLDCSFLLLYDAINMELKSKVHEKVARDIDRAENESRPMVTMLVDHGTQESAQDYSVVDFGHVRYDEPKSRFVTIANTGQCSAQFGFLNLPEQENSTPLGTVGNLAPQWLSMSFHCPSGSELRQNSVTSPRENKEEGAWADSIAKIFALDPGETMNVEIISHVKDKVLVRALNDGQSLEVVLILRIKDGTDHFLPVKASWRSSIHGRTIDRLMRIPEGGVRVVQQQRLNISIADDRSEEPPAIWSAPREIFRLTEGIESLVERIAAEWSMLGSGTDLNTRHPLVAYAGWPFVEDSWTLDVDTRRALRVDVNEALDTDQPFDSVLPSTLSPLHRLEVFSEALLDLLTNLEDGVVPSWLWEMLEADFFAKNKAKLRLSIDEKRAAVLEILSSSPSHSISFVLITSMLMRVSQEVACSVRTSQDLGGTNYVPKSPKYTTKSSDWNHDRSIAFKRLIQKNFAVVFADVLFRIPELTAKGRSAWLNHKQELVEIFLETGG